MNIEPPTLICKPIVSCPYFIQPIAIHFELGCQILGNRRQSWEENTTKFYGKNVCHFSYDLRVPLSFFSLRFSFVTK